MTSKLHREHDAQVAMLAFRTGLSASMCEAWIEAPIAKSAEAIEAALLPASDDNCVIVARSEIEAYALAHMPPLLELSRIRETNAYADV